MTTFKPDYAKMSNDALKAELAKRDAELEASRNVRLTLKVQTVKKDKTGKVIEGEAGSGAVSLYGLQRMPVTLYASQWERLVAFVKAGEIETFLAANAAIVTRR